MILGMTSTIQLLSLTIFTLLWLLPVTEQCYPRSDDQLDKSDSDQTQDQEENPFRKHLQNKRFKKKKKFEPPGPGEIFFGFQPVNILSSFLEEASVRPVANVKSHLDAVPGN